MNGHAISVVIPAAGSSRRLGQAKQLIRFKGKPLLQLAIENAGAIQPQNIIVVTGAASDEICANIVLDEHPLSPVSMVQNPDWMDGIGSSIATGINAANKDTEGVLILLADQWQIQPADLQQLTQVWIQNKDRIVVSRAGDYQGPPVIFPHDCLAALRLLSGDQGARKVINANFNRLVEVNISNAAADLDTPADLAVLISSQGQQ